MKAKVYLGLGTNQGDRENYLLQALRQLELHPQIQIMACSSIYETDPYGPVPQADFLNMAVEITTALSPYQLLEATQSIEKNLGRKREIHWGPRTIDLDILVYNQENIKSENLQIPHAELIKRDFVILPLYELSPQLVIPGINITVSQLQKKFSNSKGVRIWRQNSGDGEFGLFGS